jgi:lysophospholipase L1-like esterase
VSRLEIPENTPRRAAIDPPFHPGANDSTFPQRHQHLPLEKYSENMKYYVRSILSPSSEYYQPHAYILLLTPPPLVEKMREEAKLQYPPEQRTPADRSLDNTKRYRDEIIKIGAEFKRTNPEFADKLRVIDTWAPLIAAAGGDVRDEEAMRRFFTDGLHMTSEGYEIVYNACLDVIKKDFKGLDPDDQTSLPMTFPQ